MNFFKSYTYNWWQIGIFKLALLAIGVLIGSYWYEFFRDNQVSVIAIAVITSVYILSVSLRQSSE